MKNTILHGCRLLQVKNPPWLIIILHGSLHHQHNPESRKFQFTGQASSRIPTSEKLPHHRHGPTATSHVENPDGSPLVHTGNVWRTREKCLKISYIKTRNLIFGLSEKSKRALNCDREREERQRSESLFGLVDGFEPRTKSLGLRKRFGGF